MKSLLELAERWAASPRILILEDDPDLTQILESVLEQHDCEVVAVSTVAEAIEASQSQKFDLVFVDLLLPDGSGVRLIQSVKKRWPHTPIVVMTGLVFDSALDRALSYGPVAFLRKPSDTTFSAIVNLLAMFKLKHRQLEHQLV